MKVASYAHECQSINPELGAGVFKDCYYDLIDKMMFWPQVTTLCLGLHLRIHAICVKYRHGWRFGQCACRFPRRAWTCRFCERGRAKFSAGFRQHSVQILVCLHSSVALRRHGCNDASSWPVTCQSVPKARRRSTGACTSSRCRQSTTWPGKGKVHHHYCDSHTDRARSVRVRGRALASCSRGM